MMRPMACRRSTLLVFAAALAPFGCGLQPYTDSSTESEGGTEASSSGEPTTSAGSSGGASEASSGSTGGTSEGVPTGGCGAPEYAWLPAEGMGEILDQALVIEFDAETINGLLADNGFASLGPVEYGARVYKIRYRTQDRGAAVEATGFVAFPVMDAPAERPVVLWAHGTTGFSDMCSPTSDPTGYQIPLILAAKGYVSVAPDYLGMNGWGAPSGMLHPYVVPEPTAIATLDSARALYSFAGKIADLPSTPGPEIVLFGASEGGFATLWADRYAPHYAPELTIVANVAAVPPTDAFGLTKHGMTVFGPTTGALAAAIVGGWEWTGKQAALGEVFSAGPPVDVVTELPKQMRETCSFDLPDGIMTTDQVYAQSFIDAVVAEDWAAMGAWGCFLKQASLGTSEIPLASKTPTLVTQGEIDDLVFTPVVREDLPRLCDQGYEIEHVECAGAGHVDAVLQSVPFIIRWVDERLAGKPIADPCAIHKPVDCTAL